MLCCAVLRRAAPFPAVPCCLLCGLRVLQDSVERFEEEIPTRDNLVQLNVERRAGVHGRVVVRWRAEGENNGLYDLSPIEGEVRPTCQGSYGSQQGGVSVWSNV